MKCACGKEFTGIMQSYPICHECRLIADIIHKYGFNDVDAFIDEYRSGTIPQAEADYYAVLHLRDDGNTEDVSKGE